MKTFLTQYGKKILFSFLVATFLFGVPAQILPQGFRNENVAYAAVTDEKTGCEKFDVGTQDRKDCDEDVRRRKIAEAAQITAGTDETTIKWGKLASQFIGIFTPLIALLVKLDGLLMSNEVIVGNFGGASSEDFMPILHNVWLMIRDLVNYVFILILLGIAFMSVFGAAKPENNNFEIKKLLPKFIIALIAVNFTWFGAQVILDVANVTTHIVYAIPRSVMAGEIGDNTVMRTCEKAKDEKGNIIDDKLDMSTCMMLLVYSDNSIEGIRKRNAEKKAKEEEKAKESAAGETAPEFKERTLFEGRDFAEKGEAEAVPGTGKDVALKEIIKTIKENKDDKSVMYVQDTGDFIILWGNFNYEKFQGNSIAALFAYNVLQIQTLSETAKGGIDDFTEVQDLIVSIGFSLLFMIIIIVAYAVMTIVLIERILIIWMNMILSPIAAILPFAEDFGLSGGDFSEKGIGLKPFLQYAFFPAIMAIPLELGYILISAGQVLTNATSDGKDFVIRDSSGGELIFESELIHGVHTFHQFLWYILAIIVLWSSVEISKSTSKHMGDVIESITSKVKGVGKFIATTPMYAQFIPIATSKGGGASGEQKLALGDLSGIAEKLQRGRSQRSAERLENVMPTENLEKTIANAVSRATSGALNKALDQPKLKDELAGANKTPQKYVDFVNKHLKGVIPGLENIPINIENAKKILQEIQNTAGITPGTQAVLAAGEISATTASGNAAGASTVTIGDVAGATLKDMKLGTKALGTVDTTNIDQVKSILRDNEPQKEAIVAEMINVLRDKDQVNFVLKLKGDTETAEIEELKKYGSDGNKLPDSSTKPAASGAH
ncbi:hypothetical protein HZA38_05840 [Candidatus Peregrinibacteria bacterium]|nr:hypothetical protein [Candidatus Peregrinibacteria bacterium]